MRRAATILAAVCGLLLLGACVAGSGESQHTAAGGWVAQVLLGFWHGVIAPVTLLGEIINRFAPHALPWTVRMYETKAATMPYDVGFYLGLAGGPSILFTRRRG